MEGDYRCSDDESSGNKGKPMLTQLRRAYNASRQLPDISRNINRRFVRAIQKLHRRAGTKQNTVSRCNLQSAEQITIEESQHPPAASLHRGIRSSDKCRFSYGKQSDEIATEYT